MSFESNTGTPEKIETRTESKIFKKIISRVQGLVHYLGAGAVIRDIHEKNKKEEK